MNLRKYAEGKDCQVRIPGVCNHNSETTVLAHFRASGVSGMSLKSPDLCASWACSNCHDAIDRRGFMELDKEYVRLCHLEGVIRTQALLIERGIVTWAE
jgi:hypothetical protein